MKISAVIIAGNEEQKIGDAIKSVDWADEVLVIDSESTDRTREVAESLGARVISRPWPGFAAQKQFGVEQAKHDWILSIDADERVTELLQDHIRSLASVSQKDLPAGYRIPRRSYYMGRAINHSGWYPDWQLRLFDRRRARWGDSLVHESIQVNAGKTVAKLKGEILHLSVDSARDHHEMIGRRYAPLAARQMYERGQRTSALRVVAAGPSAFFSHYVLKAGFLDGFPGFCIARFAAYHAYLKHLLLWEMQNDEGPRS